MGSVKGLLADFVVGEKKLMVDIQCFVNVVCMLHFEVFCVVVI